MKQDFCELAMQKPSYSHAGFLSFPSKGSTLNLSTICLCAIPSLVGLPRTGTKPSLGQLAIYFIKCENFLKSLLRIKTHSKISINDLLTYSNYEKYDIAKNNADWQGYASDVNLSSLKWLIKWRNTKQSNVFSTQSITVDCDSLKI
jgi:hypothetical protein